MANDERMTDDERMYWAIIWVGLTTFASLIYLGAGILPSIIAVVFMIVSCVLGLGRRWLLRGGLALSLFALLVLLGLPSPHAWPRIAQTISASVHNCRFELVADHIH